MFKGNNYHLGYLCYNCHHHLTRTLILMMIKKQMIICGNCLAAKIILIYIVQNQNIHHRKYTSKIILWTCPAGCSGKRLVPLYQVSTAAGLNIMLVVVILIGTP